MRLLTEVRSEGSQRRLGRQRASLTLSYQLQLTEEEEDLIYRQRLVSYPLTWQVIDGARIADDTVGRLIAGRSLTVSRPRELRRNKLAIEAAVDRLELVLKVVRGLQHETVGVQVAEHGGAQTDAALDGATAGGIYGLA